MRKGEEDKTLSSVSDTTPNGVVEPTLLKQMTKPNKMVWKPKEDQKPIQLIQEQRSPTTKQEDKKVSYVAKRTSMKSISSCLSQDPILTNRFKCLEDEDEM